MRHRVAASMASRGASRVLSRWPTLDAIDAAYSPGGFAQCPAHSLALLDCRRCSAAGWAETAHPFTPSTRHLTNSGSSPSSAEPRRVPQAPRDRFASACASSSLGPWSDDPSASVGGGERTLASAGDQGGSTTGSCTRAFPFASEGASRVDKQPRSRVFFLPRPNMGEFANQLSPHAPHRSAIYR